MERAAIAVVGAGLIGATAALAASQRYPDWEVRWLDRGSMQPPPSRAEFAARVIACTPGSRALLERLKAWRHIIPESYQNYDSMSVWDARGEGAISFSAAELDVSHLGCIIEVSELLRALMAEISERPNIHQWPDTEVVGLGELEGHHRVLSLAGGESLECQLIIGVDGSHSRLRELADIKTRVRSMGQRALVAVVQHELSHQNRAWQAFHPEGPLAFLPLPESELGQHQSAIVWSLDSQVADAYLELPRGQLADLLQRAIDRRLGKILEVGELASFPLQQLHARHYCQPGLCLMGDAVHTLHPLAGQGANLGFRDVAILDREWSRARKRKLGPGDFSVLRRYERARKIENLMLLGAMEAFRYGFATELWPLRWLRNQGMRRVDRWQSLKNLMARQAML